MKSSLICVLSLLLFYQNPVLADEMPTAIGEPFALVELFGSEGCSSCPPADDLLRELTETARTQVKNIFTLSFHVDYWDYLGWVDPFSSSQFTRRQRAYAKSLKRSSVYTPQMVVNGSVGFVGSDRGLAEKYIEEYLQTPPENNISVNLDAKSGPKQIQVLYHCREWTAGAVINVALVEGGLQSQVTAGENDGRLLKHENVVREFKTVPLAKKEGMVLVSKPDGDDLSRFSVIVYLQRTNDMKILAAKRIGLSQ